MSIKDFAAALAEIEGQIEALETSGGEYARLRKIRLHDAAADACYGMAQILRDAGKIDASHKIHNLANEHWGHVMAAAAADNDPDKSSTD